MVKPVVLTEARTLTDGDSGKTYFLNSTDGFTVTLPRPRGGVNFEFIVKAVPTTADYVITAGSKIILGRVITPNVIYTNDTAWESSGATNIKFLYPDMSVGDSVECVSDGTYWYVNAFCGSADGITIAEQSKSASASPSTSPSTSPSVSPSDSE